MLLLLLLLPRLLRLLLLLPLLPLLLPLLLLLLPLLELEEDRPRSLASATAAERRTGIEPARAWRFPPNKAEVSHTLLPTR